MSALANFPGSIPSWEPQSAAEVAPEPLADMAATVRSNVFAEIDWIEAGARPEGISKPGWYHLIRDLRAVTDQWLDIALGCGWDLLDLYGSPPTPGGRVGLMGVAMLLHGRSIEGIDTDRIAIANRTGAPNTYYRIPPGCTVPIDRLGQVLIWQAIENVRVQCANL